METKQGWKTTEFWMTVALHSGALISAVSGALPPQYAVIASAISQGLYNISRGEAKKGIKPEGKEITPLSGITVSGAETTGRGE